MSKKNKTQYVCSDCGADYPRWQGQCTECKEWNTVSEFKEPIATKVPGKKYQGYAGNGVSGSKNLSEIETEEKRKILTGIGEFDRVMGNGITIGSVNLISGDPGAGKTTLLSKIIGVLSQQGMSLYATSEESLSQFKIRFDERLKIAHNDSNLKLTSEADVDLIIQEALNINAKFLVVDSIQSVASEDFTGQPGSISQVKGCAQALTQMAKKNGITVFLIGHVNKSNEVAGPKTLVHIVDGLFHIEVNDSELRTVRPNKNRFGDVDTVGLFRMTEKGMLSVDNPSKIFLSSLVEPTYGTAITCIRDGTRNLLLEIQSLVTEAEGDYPQRVSVGLNMNRLKMVTAILRKHGRLKMNHDTYVSLVGGLKIAETESSADLALAMTLYSSVKEIVLPRHACFMGELSLSGEVRPINGGVPRVKEAIKHGFTDIYIPHANFHNHMEAEGVNIIKLKTITDALKRIG
jgi:DNA repair protein RadA/Sms